MFGHHHGRHFGRGGHGRPSGEFEHGPGGERFGRGRFGRRGFDDGFGGGRHGRGRMFGSGDLRLVLLALIAEKPSHGYELIRAIEAKFGGAYAPSPGAVYPTLTLLEEQDFVRSEAQDGSKKVFSIMPEGRAYLAENEATVRGVMARMELSAESRPGEGADVVREAIHTLRHAIAMQRRWTPDEAERIRAIIERAAREIVVGAPAGEARKGE